jgi:hypothetical protein
MLQDAGARRSRPRARRRAPDRASRTDSPPYRTPRPASVRRSARRGPSTCAAQPCFPCPHSPHVPAAPPYLWSRHRTLAGAHARRGRVTAPRRACTTHSSPWCARIPHHRLASGYKSPAVLPRASTRAPPRSPLPPPVSTSLRLHLWPFEHA